MFYWYAMMRKNPCWNKQYEELAFCTWGGREHGHALSVLEQWHVGCNLCKCLDVFGLQSEEVYLLLHLLQMYAVGCTMDSHINILDFAPGSYSGCSVNGNRFVFYPIVVKVRVWWVFLSFCLKALGSIVLCLNTHDNCYKMWMNRTVLAGINVKLANSMNTW